MAKIDIKKSELVWLGKYREDSKLNPVEKPGPYPFQIVESINVPRVERPASQLVLFDTWKGNEGSTFEEGWKTNLSGEITNWLCRLCLKNLQAKLT